MVRIVKVIPLENFQLKILLSNGRNGVFDVSPYLNIGVFNELKDKRYFRQVKIAYGGISWPNEQDFSAETIEYELKPERLIRRTKVSA